MQEDDSPVIVDGVELTGEDAHCYQEWGVTLDQEAILIRQLRDELNLEVSLTPEWGKLEVVTPAL